MKDNGWGGRRPGSGRRSEGRVKLQCYIKPETLAKIQALQNGATLGEVIDQLLQNTKDKRP